MAACTVFPRGSRWRKKKKPTSRFTWLAITGRRCRCTGPNGRCPWMATKLGWRPGGIAPHPRRDQATSCLHPHLQLVTGWVYSQHTKHHLWPIHRGKVLQRDAGCLAAAANAAGRAVRLSAGPGLQHDRHAQGTDRCGQTTDPTAPIGQTLWQHYAYQRSPAMAPMAWVTGVLWYRLIAISTGEQLDASPDLQAMLRQQDAWGEIGVQAAIDRVWLPGPGEGEG